MFGGMWLALRSSVGVRDNGPEDAEIFLKESFVGDAHGLRTAQAHKKSKTCVVGYGDRYSCISRIERATISTCSFHHGKRVPKLVAFHCTLE